MDQNSNLEIKVIASGSKGNCYYLNDGSTALLLECGIKFKDIQKALNFNLSEIKGVLLSHEHGDHSKAFKDVLKHGLKIYSSLGTIESLDHKNYYPNIIYAGKPFFIGTWSIYPFDVKHDAAEPLGFVLTSENGYRVLFATDTYVIPYHFPGVTHMLIESNYDENTLQDQISEGLPKFRYARLIKSHQSLQSVLMYLEKVDKSKLEEIHLIHLSEGNANKDFMINKVEELNGIKTYAHGGI